MCQQLCSLKLSSNSLSSMGLDARKTDLKNASMSMLAKWMHDEEQGIDVDEYTPVLLRINGSGEYDCQFAS